MALYVGTKPSTRQKHSRTARERGRAIADSPDMIKRKSSRRWWVASVTDPGLWYGVILGAAGLVCACPGQQERGGICKHTVAVDIALGRAWDRAKGMLARVTNIVPQRRCHHCPSKRFVKYGKRRNTKAGPRQRYKCKECRRTFSGEPGFKGKQHKPREIARALQEVVAGLSLRQASYVMERDGISVDPSTIHRWMVEYSGMLNRFSKTLRPRLGHRWHCDEVFFRILGLERWLFTVMDGRTRFIMSWDISHTKTGYRPLRLFLAARDLAGVDPWVFVTDGLDIFARAAGRAFRRRWGFRMVHIREVHTHNQLNFNNIIEKLNGEFKHRIKTARGFNPTPDRKADRLPEGGCPALIRMMIIHHNFFRSHMGLDGRTPAEAAGITIHGEDKWVTMICNAALSAA